MPAFDVVVIGLGAMGSAAVYQLARRGKRVIGIDRFEPGHAFGSSHGATRIIRLGYFEHPSYVPLLRRAYALWRDLEAACRQPLLRVTGIAEIGPPDGTLVTGTLAAARLHALPHTVLAASDVMRRLPFRIPADYLGVLQPDGGILSLEPAILAHLSLAQAAGAELRTRENVRIIAPWAGGVRIGTDRGDLEAGAAIVAAGPWMKKLLPDLRAPLRVTRQVMAWFEPLEAALFTPDRFPVFLLESPHGVHYGFPLDDTGVKVAKHHHGDETVDPDTCDPQISNADEVIIRSSLAEYLPAANGPLKAAQTCLYTMAPDGDFVIDSLGPIVVASACSGHGFKFAPVVGEIVADLATTGATCHDISRFRLDRFGPA
ncbi:MAG: N-methyl-L-tryptophan oxidase [Xanthobacteraceae bacterium]